jgi:benzylsuccinate CoA-transferase BbsF subunit
MTSLSGLESLSLYHDDSYPCLGPFGYGDSNAGIHAVFAILAALRYRQRTGQGQYIDLSEWEACTFLLGEPIMEVMMTGRPPRILGNRHPSMAPHGVYPCKGEDKWVSIAVGSDEEWASLCQALGNPPWSQEDMFSDSLGRLRHQDELDKFLSEWTSNHTPEEVTQILQAAKVAVAPVLGVKDHYADKHLTERGLYTEVQHPRMGCEVVSFVPWKLSETPGGVCSSAPLLGQHNDYVFIELLGMSREELEQLKSEKAIY